MGRAGPAVQGVSPKALFQKPASKQSMPGAGSLAAGITFQLRLLESSADALDLAALVTYDKVAPVHTS